MNHPHICILYDVGQHEGADYLVMEFVEGETLAERLKKGPLPFDQTLSTAIEVADALGRAHRQGVIHRDLKPGNIMLTKSGSKLMDFGLAKLTLPRANAEGSALPETASEPLTGDGTVMGTLPYMAPEQLEGKGADPRSDLSSFGCVLCEMTTGRRAFEGTNRAGLVSAIMTSDPPPVGQLQPLTPLALERLVKASLAKDPDERTQTAHDMKQQLKWIAEAPTGTQAVTGIGLRPVTSGRRRWGLVVGAFASLTSLALGVVLDRQLLLHAQPRMPIVRSLLDITPPEEVNSSESSRSSSTLGGTHRVGVDA